MVEEPQLRRMLPVILFPAAPLRLIIPAAWFVAPVAQLNRMTFTVWYAVRLLPQPRHHRPRRLVRVGFTNRT
jgi:hypothetical protein